jgi:hypothetical protein
VISAAHSCASADESQVDLVHEGGRSQRVAGFLIAHERAGQSPQLVVHERVEASEALAGGEPLVGDLLEDRVTEGGDAMAKSKPRAPRDATSDSANGVDSAFDEKLRPSSSSARARPTCTDENAAPSRPR